eukprot:1886256-Karenia_brevis.AAC.1
MHRAFRNAGICPKQNTIPECPPKRTQRCCNCRIQAVSAGKFAGAAAVRSETFEIAMLYKPLRC